MRRARVRQAVTSWRGPNPYAVWGNRGSNRKYSAGNQRVEEETMEIDQMIAGRHLTTHPFYQRWQSGTVTHEVLREYAKQYYAYESSLPKFLERAIAHLEDGPARRALEENLADETGNPEPHPNLWLRFAAGLGLSPSEVRSAELLSGTRTLVETYATLCDRGWEEALGALYAYESQFSVVATAKADGLRDFYAVTDPEALEFFDWHSSLDDEHAAALRSALAETERTKAAVDLALDAWWSMLDQFEEMSASAE